MSNLNKVLWISSTALPEAGGIQRLVDDLINSTNLLFIIPHTSSDYYSHKSTVFPILKGDFFDPFRVLFLCKQNSISIVVANDFISDMWRCSLLPLFGIDIHCISHGSDLSVNRRFKYGRSLKLHRYLQMRFGLFLAKKKVTVSSMMQDHIYKQHGYQFFVIHNFSSSHPSLTLSTQCESDYPSFPAGFNVVCLSGHRPIKNIKSLVSSFSALSYQHPQSFLHIFGSGSDTKQLVNYASLSCRPDSCFFYGQVSANSTASIYNQASVVVCPSIFEPFGLVIIESLLAGTPVVCGINSVGPELEKMLRTVNSSELTEFIDIINVENISEFADVLISRAKNTDTRPMSSLLLDTLSSYFSVDRSVSNFSALIGDDS